MMGVFVKTWTDAMDGTLKVMWADGAPARIIGYEIGRSKNAIIGRAHRLGLALHRDVKRELPKVKRHRNMTKRVPVVAKQTTQRLHLHPGRAPVVLTQEVYEGTHYEAPATRKTLLELTERDCRWPCGDPGTPDFFFCGAPQDGLSYCREHCAIAYNKPVPVQRRPMYREAA